MTRFEKQTPYLNTAIVLGTGAVFATDVVTPLGLAGWVFYLVPMAISLFVWQPRTPVRVALVCTLLLVAGYYLSPPGPSGRTHWIPQVNRVMAVAAIWVVAFVARQTIVTRLKLAERDWLQAGHAQLSTCIQGEQKLSELGDNILGFLCRYLDAPVGALYVSDDDGVLRREAGYALSHAAGARETIAEGEGLIGQAVKDQRVHRIEDVPEGYLPVNSGLGQSGPKTLVIAPLHADGAKQGALELGLMHSGGQATPDLLQAVAEPIAIAIRSARYRARQAELLEETQRQAAELQSQQEELRVTNEELEEQSRALKDSQARLENQQAELEQTNIQLEEQSAELERQRDGLARAQVDLLANAKELRRANQYKSEFLANMSHELRTPLNSALILARLLADNKQGNLTPEQVRYASTIHQAGNDLLQLINDILDLSRVEAGKMELHAEPVDLPETLRALRDSFQPMAAQKHLEFEASLGPGVPTTLTTDGRRLQQVLRNLLSNAVKFTESGAVSLRVEAAVDGRIAISVRDSGIGIAADRQQVIFEAFRQADGTTSRRYGGTGLGLTISRELARRLGGDISVESEPGKGSVFTLTIPCVLAEPGHVPHGPPEPRQKAGEQAESKRDTQTNGRLPEVQQAVDDDRDGLRAAERSILVIEDDVSFATILRDMAREQRFRVAVATTAAEGMALAEQFLPSAVLLDVHLPDESGLSVLEHLKRNAATRHIPVHVVSAVDYTQQALEMGAIGYALKPVRREQIAEAIGKLEKRLDQKLRRVLVVEDVSIQRDSIVQLLGGENVSVVPVATGAEALERLRATTFDCMVLDLTLPDMTGYDLLDRMAAGEAFSFPPVIVYTGRALSSADEERLRRYASSIIIKGVRSPERLLDEVTLFLHQVEGTLPAEQQRILREVRNREAALEGRNVLVVDDDARNVFALASVLESKGARVRMARNGKEALSALRASSSGADGGGVDLVLMDIMMPEMDGLTAIREIRKGGEWKKLPVIALTAKAMPKDREECLGAGADDYIAKPLDIDKLLSLVKVWIPK